MTTIAESPPGEFSTPAKTPTSNAYDRAMPAFLVGVTGYMTLDPDQATLVARRLRLVFRYLRKGGRASDPEEPSQTLARSLARLTVPQSTPQTETRRTAERAYERLFAAWPGLGDVPIAVMSNLAPGVDTIAVRIALEPEFAADSFHVRAPLPFPAEIYQDASTFVRGDDGDGRRQRDFDDLLDAIGDKSVFPVRLQRDLETPPERQIDALVAERDDPSSSALRHERYYAAGEYLAVTSHVLVGVWDGTPGDSPGTASVVQARLEGPRDDLLTMSQGIRQPAGGPAIHLYASRPGADDAGSSIPALRMLYPFAMFDSHAPSGGNEGRERLLGEGQGGWLEPTSDDGRREEIVLANRRALAAQQDRFAVLCRIAANLRAFADCPPHPTAANCDADYRELLRYKRKDFYPHICAMRMEGEVPAGDAEGEFGRAQRALSFLSFKGNSASGKLKEKHDRSLKILFWVTLFAAALLHLYAHWHVHAQETSRTEPAQHASASASDVDHVVVEASPTSVDAESGHKPADADEPPKIAFGTFAALLAAGALLLFFYCRMRQYAERHHDYRALAEGVRVQFYWNLAGLGQSVSANYMHRQRSELDWIRGAIRSVSFPYEAWRERFLRLSRADRLVALECVRSCWVEVQRDYFEKTWHKHHHKLHAWHKLGAALALAGVGLVALCVWQSWGGREPSPWLMLALPIAAGLLWSAVMAFRWFTGDLPESAEHPSTDDFWVRCIHWLAPAPENHVTAYCTPVERFLRSIVGFCARLPLALLSIYVVYETTRLIGLEFAHAWSIPEGKEWRVIVGGVALLAGALAVAWSEKNLLSELAYQYNTMHSLFRDATHRLSVDLAALEDLEEDTTGAYDQKLEEIHEYLYALGKEALDENAEWLLLHRARPLEPVMAG